MKFFSSKKINNLDYNSRVNFAMIHCKDIYHMGEVTQKQLTNIIIDFPEYPNNKIINLLLEKCDTFRWLYDINNIDSLDLNFIVTNILDLLKRISSRLSSNEFTNILCFLRQSPSEKKEALSLFINKICDLNLNFDARCDILFYLNQLLSHEDKVKVCSFILDSKSHFKSIDYQKKGIEFIIRHVFDSNIEEEMKNKLLLIDIIK